ncbi:MAG TPA: serine/threonine-protein kinase [Thermoanaerobaculia bacterium]
MLPLTPTRLGRYEILDELGKGAMGVVYLARDPLIGRLVALKTFRIGYSVKDQELEQFRVRFMREAQSAGILTHPHIVTIHDVVEASEEGLAFIAMEYVKGTNLKLMLQGDQPLALPFVLDIVSQVGDALDYAHANRVIHRDVKPANILITPENRVKITDFGIARLESSNLTQEGQLLGTPNYMAPEQIQGKEVDHRADLFSLGVVLYEMLTRHKPFQGENLTVVSHRIVYDHFTPPRDYVQGLPPGLDRILARALEKDPGRRYQRAREMVDDLRRVVESSSVQRDDLNETQSLSATMVLPPPDVPPPPPPPAAAKPSVLGWWKKKPAPVPPPPVPAADPGTGTGSRSGTGSQTPVPAISEADTLATKAPPPRPKTNPRRMLIAAVVGLVLAAVVAAGLTLAGNGIQPTAKGRDAQEDAYRKRVVWLTDEAERRLNAADYDTALSLYNQALAQAPRSRTLRRGREKVLLEREKFQRMLGHEQEIVLALQDAEKLLADRRYNDALAKAAAVLKADRGNLEAVDIIEKAREGLARTGPRTAPTSPWPREARQGEEIADTPSFPTESDPGQTTETAPAAEARTANLNVHFRSEASGSGTVIVFVNNVERYRGEFFPGRSGGFLKSAREDRREFSRNLEIRPGHAEIRVHVTLEGKGADVERRTATFSGGDRLNLDIRFLGPKQLSVNLQ